MVQLRADNRIGPTDLNLFFFLESAIDSAQHVVCVREMR